MMMGLSLGLMVIIEDEGAENVTKTNFSYALVRRAMRWQE